MSLGEINCISNLIYGLSNRLADGVMASITSLCLI